MDIMTTRRDMTVQLHLDALTLQDRARPDDSPFRNMMYSTPDETSHGGLIHVTYWASAGGERRVPPASIADTGDRKEYDMVVDARFSTLQVGDGVGRPCARSFVVLFYAGVVPCSTSTRECRGRSQIVHGRSDGTIGVPGEGYGRIAFLGLLSL